jgi:hypothetical protein
VFGPQETKIRQIEVAREKSTKLISKGIVMKNSVIASLLLAAILVVAGIVNASAASTYTVGSPATNVGEVDELLDQATLADSGDATELAWVQSVLGEDASIVSKTDTTSSNWEQSNESTNVYAYDFGDGQAPADYFIKVGVGNNDNTDTHYLFKNLNSLRYAVVDLLNSFGEGMTLKNIGKVSHIGPVDPGSEVPLPAAAWLFGSGLLGFVGLSRRRSSGKMAA